MKWLVRSMALASILIGTLGPASSAQTGQTPPAADPRRAQATRPELEEELKGLESVIASSGYSKSFRRAREDEAAMVRLRLSEGDFQIGDQIEISVTGEQALTGKFVVLPGRTMELPQLPPISLVGVLRSEIRGHLSTEIGKYVKNPQVVVQGSSIRLSILGAVGRPGYYTLPADNLVSDAIMAAGGPAAYARMEKSAVRRSGRDVIDGEELAQAIEAGRSLDQINLHGGDELFIGGRATQQGGVGPRNNSVMRWIWPIQAVVSFGFLITRIF